MKLKQLWVIGSILVLVGAGCSSGTKPSAASGSSATKPAGASGGRTYAIGVLTDMTGIISATEHNLPLGVQAGIGIAKTQGYNFRYVLADTGSSPSGALTGAQRLVEQDHVFAIIMETGFGFSAAPYLAKAGIPVFGANVDGPEWNTDRNMFSVFG
jgi:branched-chain amino acid transport system substrate-binding protein